MRAERFVVSGAGVVSPLGIGRESFWGALLAGRSAVAPIRRFEPGAEPPRLGAEVTDLAPQDHLPAALLRRMDRLSQMIGVAAALAVADAGLEERGDDVGVVVGSALGNLTETAQFLERVFTKGPSLASPMLFPNLVLNAPASQIAMALGVRGANLTVSGGEISGELALDTALGLLRAGRASAVVVAAGDELAEVVFRARRRFGDLSPRGGGTERSRPLDAGANGAVLGEGAAALVLEPEGAVADRGRQPLAAIGAVASFSLPAANPYVWPAPGTAPVPPIVGDPDAVFCGADSSPERDALELSVLAGFADRRRPIFSPCGALGTHGSLGLTTVVCAALAVATSQVPPIAGLERPRPESGFDHPQQARAGALRHVLVLGVARGGAGVTIEVEAV